MEVGKVIYGLLSQGTAGPLVVDRVFPVVIPQSESFPSIAYSIISGERVDTKDATNNMVVQRFQVDIFAKTYPVLVDISNAVKNDLDWGRGETFGVKYDGIRYVTEVDARDEELKLFHKSIDFQIRIKL